MLGPPPHGPASLSMLPGITFLKSKHRVKKNPRGGLSRLSLAVPCGRHWSFLCFSTPFHKSGVFFLKDNFSLPSIHSFQIRLPGWPQWWVPCLSIHRCSLAFLETPGAPGILAVPHPCPQLTARPRGGTPFPTALSAGAPQTGWGKGKGGCAWPLAWTGKAEPRRWVQGLLSAGARLSL